MPPQQRLEHVMGGRRDLLLHQRRMHAHRQQFLLRPDHPLPHHGRLARRIEHSAQMVLILLAQIQRPANPRKHLGRHVALDPVVETADGAQVVPLFLELAHQHARAMYQRVGDRLYIVRPLTLLEQRHR